MARNSWYDRKEETYLMKRSREMKILELRYGCRKAIYEQIARELKQRFGVRRSWRGVRQRAQLLLRPFESSNGEMF